MAETARRLDPSTAPVACWRFVPGKRARWQSGILSHDANLDGWMWEDADPEDAPPDSVRAYWTPPLLDAHTHLGDAFLRPSRDNLPRSIEALVAPPHGVKHKELARADDDQVQKAIRERARRMAGNGTATAIDFREGGLDGLRMLLPAVSETGLDVQPLGRPCADPDDGAAWDEEADRLLKGPTLGLGLSGVRDLPPQRLEEAAEACRRRGKPLALHLAESRHEPLEEALRYGARLLVHLVQTRKDEWDELADHDVLAVACPTSNRFFGLASPLARFHRAFREDGLKTAFGTDNAMLGDGDLRDEARLAAQLHPEGDLDWMLQSLTWNPWQALKLGPDPDHPGLLWGLGEKTPAGHPEETPLARTMPLWNTQPRMAPRVRGAD